MATELRARYSAPMRWPSVPRVLPTQTTDLLANTSIAPATLPSLPRASRSAAERQARSLRQHEVDLQVRERQAEMQQQHREARAALRADRKADELIDHRRGYDSLKENLEDVLLSYKNDSNIDPSEGTRDDFLKHMENARIVTPVPVRQYDIIGWYKKMPHDVTNAVVALIEHFHTKARLDVELNQLEKQAGSWGGEIHPHEAYAGEYNRKGGSAFGYEIGRPRRDFETYESPSEDQIHLQHLIASFEVRKIRVFHAEEHWRATEPLAASAWEKTLDYSLIRFMGSAVQHIANLTINVLDQLSIKDEIKALVDKAITEESQDLAVLIDLFQKILDRLVEVGQEMEKAQRPEG